MKLYTRTGDDGSTALFDGRRVDKDHPRVAAYGAVDELNALIGWAAAATANAGGAALLRDRLTHVQRELFEVGSDLATPQDSKHRDKIPTVTAEQIARLEQWIDEACAAVRPLKSFILPGGGEAACRLHVARAAARRAERDVITLSHAEPIGPHVVPYLNRLADLLFAWARWGNALDGVEDVEWHPPKRD